MATETDKSGETCFVDKANFFYENLPVIATVCTGYSDPKSIAHQGWFTLLVLVQELSSAVPSMALPASADESI